MNTAIRNGIPERSLSERLSGADPAKSAWSTLETLIAVLIDETRMSNWMYASAHSDNPIPKPEPLRRPGVATSRRRALSLADARAIDPRLRTMPDDEAVETFRRLHGG